MPDINTYTVVLRGYANRSQPMGADVIFRRLYDRFMATGDRELMPTTEAYNQLIRAWMRSGTRSAASVTEDLLNEMVDANEDAALPNAETFARVMNCHTQASKGNDASSNAQRLMDKMQKLYESGIETLKPNTEVYNAKIKSLAVPGVSDGAVRAVDALHWLVNEYREGNKDLRPTRATFIAAINAQTTNGGKRAAQEAEKLFDLMQTFAKEFKDDQLLPNVRVYNALIRCWARSREKNKAERTRQLLEAMVKESDLRGDDEVTPNHQTYNGVLNACSFPSRGTTIESKYAAFRIAVQTLNELQASESCEPSHVSYGTFLRSCGNLMPLSPKRDAVVGNIFRKCCEEGFVSQFVMDSVSDAASESLKSTLFEDVVGGKLPREWNRNL
uniref:Pentacotripeptide-repeat region of PRORP domain-containing protein n=1 Tax=Minutocellus polymorphus TaxID=265543 RepID=A0A7S0AGT9_9STRA